MLSCYVKTEKSIKRLHPNIGELSLLAAHPRINLKTLGKQIYQWTLKLHDEFWGISYAKPKEISLWLRLCEHHDAKTSKA